MAAKRIEYILNDLMSFYQLHPLGEECKIVSSQYWLGLKDVFQGRVSWI